MARITIGKPDTRPDAASHVEGVKMGNEPGGYEKSGGHLPDGRSTAERSTGISPGKHGPIDPRMPNISPP